MKAIDSAIKHFENLPKEKQKSLQYLKEKEPIKLKKLLDPFLKLWIELDVGECHTLYKATNNPLFIWKAYRICRSNMITIPEWILKYLDDTAENLIINRKEKRPFGDIMRQKVFVQDALKLNAGPGNSYFIKFEELEILQKCHARISDYKTKGRKNLKLTRGEDVYDLVYEEMKNEAENHGIKISARRLRESYTKINELMNLPII